MRHILFRIHSRGCTVSSLGFQNLVHHVKSKHDVDTSAVGWKKGDVMSTNPRWEKVFDKDTKYIPEVPPLLHSHLDGSRAPDAVTGVMCKLCGDVQSNTSRSNLHHKRQQLLKTPCVLHVGRGPDTTSVSCFNVNGVLR